MIESSDEAGMTLLDSSQRSTVLKYGCYENLPQDEDEKRTFDNR